MKLACRECGTVFSAQRHGQEFCRADCRRSFHNRKARRGAQLYDLVMALRFERPRAYELGAWGLLCRFAAACKAADDHERAGRRSWDGIEEVRSRSAHLLSTIVGTVAARKRNGRLLNCTEGRSEARTPAGSMAAEIGVRCDVERGK